ncbi:MAG: aldo/keto reductase [Armatimonadetes bacterium]|nr:aldo/keto reductase [Armatimonadota bacterium]
MKTQLLGKSDLRVTSLAYGCMRIARTWNPAEFTPAHEEAGRQSLMAAYETGYTFFDHADIYGRTLCESIHGRLLAESPELRAKTLVATKCGIRFPGEPDPDSPHRYDFSKSHIIESAERSRDRLQVETIDLYQLHRPDILMDPREVAEAFETLSHRKIVRFFGVSNFRPSMVDLLNANLDQQLLVNQIEISLGHPAPFEDGVVDNCMIHDLTPLAWSPLAGGWLADADADLSAKSQGQAALHALVGEVAERHNTSRQNICYAYLLAHPSQIIPIVGTTDPARIADSAKALDIALGREDWYRLHVAARGAPLP